MALALNNLKRVDMPLNKETKPNLILEAAPSKNGAVQPLDAHLTNHQIKRARLSWRSSDEFITEVLSWPSSQGHFYAGLLAKTYLLALCKHKKLSG